MTSEQAVISRVAVFRSAAEPADAIPGQTVLTGMTRSIGGSSSGHEIWASLSIAQLCVQVGEDGASACIAPERFTRGPLVVGASRSGPNTPPSTTPPPPQELAGVAPDGIASVTIIFGNGTKETAAVVDNGFYISGAGQAVKQIDWTTTSGELVTGPQRG
ncbi:MAG: hypothetical protein ACYCUM_12335 [Solirubrobacteraceae bacterium]